MRIAAVVLAGGRGSRLGAAVPKPLVEIAGRTLLARALAAIPEGVRPVLLAARAKEGFEAYGCPVLSDLRTDFAGPLAGLEAAAASPVLAASGATHLLALPGDTPFLTRESLAPLLARPGPLPRVARHEQRLHPTVALWPRLALDGLTAFLDAPGRHSIQAYLEATGFEAVDIEGVDPFFNVNTPSDLVAAERRIASG